MRSHNSPDRGLRKSDKFSITRDIISIYDLKFKVLVFLKVVSNLETGLKRRVQVIFYNLCFANFLPNIIFLHEDDNVRIRVSDDIDIIQVFARDKELKPAW